MNTDGDTDGMEVHMVGAVAESSLKRKDIGQSGFTKMCISRAVHKLSGDQALWGPMKVNNNYVYPDRSNQIVS